MTITIQFPVSRIEGHAKVVVDIDHGTVRSARFLAQEYRGFEQFLKGMPAEQMPVIVPRVCGVCSTSHHIAAVEALEVGDLGDGGGHHRSGVPHDRP